MDATPFKGLQPADSDLLLCYDYRHLRLDLDLDPTVLHAYTEMRVVAWSMGVWAATVVLSPAPTLAAMSESVACCLASGNGGEDVAVQWPRCVDCVAINGTPMPVDDRYGIPEAIFHGTLQGLDARNLEKFYRRMCVNRESLSFFLTHRPQRPVEELQEELQAIGAAARQQSGIGIPRFGWRRCLVGSRDLIFPSDHQQAAWEHLRQDPSFPRIELIDEPHYTARMADELTRPWPVTSGSDCIPSISKPFPSCAR